jgi:hypothetical protein
MLVIAIGVADAIRYLHSLGMAHGGIRPANIFLNDELRPKLAGFGEAVRGVQPLEQGRYLPPQTSDGDNPFSLDGYAFSVLLYELITGKTVEKLAQKDGCRVPSIKHNPHFCGLLFRCWNRPSLRPPIGEVLAFLMYYAEGIGQGPLVKDELLAYATQVAFVECRFRMGNANVVQRWSTWRGIREVKEWAAGVFGVSPVRFTVDRREITAEWGLWAVDPCAVITVLPPGESQPSRRETSVCHLK